MRHLETYKTFESNNINMDELKDTLVDLGDDWFEVKYDDTHGLCISIILPSRTGKTITGPYTGTTKRLADIYSWIDIKDSVDRLTYYIDSLGIKYNFLMVDSTGKSHKIDIINDEFKCINNNGSECQMCKYGSPKINLTTNIYVFDIIIYNI